MQRRLYSTSSCMRQARGPVGLVGSRHPKPYLFRGPCWWLRPSQSTLARTAQRDVLSVIKQEPSPREFAAARKVLGRAIEAAVMREDYRTAASLKNEMENLKSQDPSYGIRVLMQEAVMGEQYEVAHQLQARLQELEVFARSTSRPSNLEAHSTTEISGIQLEAQSSYQPEESAPQVDEFQFRYSVKITNKGQSSVQFTNRVWKTVDVDGHEEKFSGLGVLAQQPTLAPGQSITHSSTCRLSTAVGFMVGEYTLRLLDDASGELGDAFMVNVAPFKLSVMD